MKIKKSFPLILLIAFSGTNIFKCAARAEGHRQISGRTFVSWPQFVTCGPLIFGGPERSPTAASVTVKDQKGEIVAKVQSEADGYFEIDGLKPGTYRLIATVEAELPGPCLQYLPDEREVSMHKKETEFLTLNVRVSLQGPPPYQ